MTDWATWRLAHATWDMCRCGDTFWVDSSGRWDHRVLFGHAAITSDEFAAARVRVEALFAARGEG